MRRKSKPFLLVAAILAGIYLLATLGLNLFLRSSGTQDRLRSALEPLVGSPVRIRSTLGIPFGPIWLSGITPTDLGRANLVSINSLSFSLDDSALLHGVTAIQGVTLNSPVLRIRLDSLTAPDASKSTGTPPTSPSSSGPTLRQLPGEEAPAATVTPSVSLPAGFQTLRVRNGELSVLGAAFGEKLGRPVIAFSGLNLEADRAESGSWSGILSAGRTVLGKALLLHDLRAPLLLSSDLLSVSSEKFSARFGEGMLTGSLRCALPPGAPAYKASLSLSGASLKRALADFSIGDSSADGHLGGDLLLSGIAASPSTMEGEGALTCTGAVIQPVDFLKQIGRILQIDELQLLRLEEAKCRFRIHQGGVLVEDLLLRSKNLMLGAKGPVSPSGELNLESRLLLNEKLSGRLRGLLGSQLSPAPEPGYSQITFHVSGNPANPKTDLLQRLTGLKIGIDLGGLLQGLFAHPAPNR